MKIPNASSIPSTLASTLALLCLLALTLAAPALAAGSKKADPVDEAAKAYNKGVEQLADGNLDRARKSFEKALDKREDFAEAHNNLGYALRKLGEENWDAAEEHYNRALELNPELAQAYHYRGVLHVLRGDEAAAKADHAKLSELKPELADQLMEVLATGSEPADGAGVAGEWSP
ncbi:MAG: tetratricopeptide repeat protein [Acidobacteriota bacterium]